MKRDIFRRSCAEFLGTFALVFFGCGVRAIVGDTENIAGIFVVHLTFGLTVAAMIYLFSYLSAAVFNPAITLGFAITRRLPWRLMLPYWLAQFAGACSASLVHMLLFPDKAELVHYGANTLKTSLPAAIILEALLTFVLMMVSMGSATDKRFVRADSGLTVGFTIIVCGILGNSLTGGSMNPARSLGPALFAGGAILANSWVYIVGPCLGALLGALVYELLRGNQENAKPVLEDYPVAPRIPIQHIFTRKLQQPSQPEQDQKAAS
ncbi:MIP/aquaporin family protein [Ktedonobacter robiniae]|uniref:Aquaporin Z n=1 Tax=Ktedonobacter robiniae TaxID=2778365 RepID=A0ABQ3UNH5_9CHLR|nr:MIP/aquaporin family protein [Ktedonobacter robiniae]GHO54304.1 aquaporin Z [Ktedonobacter robiniae]